MQDKDGFEIAMVPHHDLDLRDPELAAIRRIMMELLQLNDKQRARIVDYLHARYGMVKR